MFTNVVDGLIVAGIGAVLAYVLAMVIALVKGDRVYTDGFFRRDNVGILMAVLSVPMIVGGLAIRGYEFTGALLGIGGFLLVLGVAIAMSPENTRRFLSVSNIGFLLVGVAVFVLVTYVIIPIGPSVVDAWNAFVKEAPIAQAVVGLVVSLLLFAAGVYIVRMRSFRRTRAAFTD